MTVIRTLAFAELDTPIVGAAWAPADEGPVLLGCRVGSEQLVVRGRLSVGDEREPWRLEGDGVALAFTPTGPSVPGGPTDSAWSSIDQRCQVSGTLALDGGGSREIQCMGSRGSVEGRFELAGIDSFRHTYGWFEGDGGLALLAYRPEKSRGQDSDLVAGAVLEAEPAPRVVDPRLSTTYDAAGAPVRVGLEMWFEHEESGEDADEEDERQFSRRAAAEATGERIDWEVAGFRLQAALLRWHSRGHYGTGVYLLGQRG